MNTSGLFQGFASEARERTSPKQVSTVKVILAFAILAVAAVLLANKYFAIEEETFLEEKKAALAGAADLKVSQIVSWRNERLSDANYVLNNSRIAVLAQKLMQDSSDASAREEMQAWMASMLRNHHYDQIVLLDPHGNPFLALPPGRDHVMSEDCLEACLNASLKSRRSTYCDLVREPNGRISLSLYIPLVLEKNIRQAEGYVQLIVDPTKELYPLIQGWVAGGKTAEVVLVRREGMDVLYLNELRHLKGSALKLRRPINGGTLPAAVVAQGREGIVEGVDYRDVQVLACARRVPDSPWFLILKEDRSEIAVPFRQHARLIVILLGLLILMAGASVLLLLEKVRLQQEMEKEELLRQYESLVQHANDAIFVMDQNLNIVEANTKASEMFGYTHDEFLGMHIDRLRPASEEDKEQLRAQVEAEGGTIFESRHLKKDGTVITVESSVRKIELRGKPHFQSIKRDISERRKAEDRMRRLEQAVNQSPASIVITDTHGNIEYVNTRFTEITGYSSAEVLGKNPRVLKSGKTPHEVYEVLWKTIAAGGEWEGELCNKKKNGEFFWEHASISPVHDASGAITHFIAVKEDITSRKQLEAQLIRSQRLESIGTLAGGIAHDLNNVLAPILISIEVLRERVRDSLSLDMLRTLENAATRGKEVIRQLLSFARGMTGEPAPLHLTNMLREIENIARETFPRAIRIEFHVAADLAMVLGDMTQIHQALMNLCVNARDAMPEGGVLTVTAENVELDADSAQVLGAGAGAYVKLRVGDTGPGIPPEILDRIFDPFFTTKEVGAGTGLGLSITHTIVKNHKGVLQVNSEAGKSCQFSIYLPVLKRIPETAAVIEPAGLSRGNGEHVLVVDDEDFVRNVTRQMLETYGYHVDLASGGKEAVEFYQTHHAEIKLVLTDWMMPQMDGAQTIRKLQQVNPQVKVIVTTGLLDQSGAGPENTPGVLKILSKPYKAAELLGAVRAALQE